MNRNHLPTWPQIESIICQKFANQVLNEHRKELEAWHRAEPKDGKEPTLHTLLAAYAIGEMVARKGGGRQ